MGRFLNLRWATSPATTSQSRNRDNLFLKIDKFTYHYVFSLKVFNETTIFFCDIVGFTNIASDSTANQIIDFLNDLYSLFDERLDNYDVYKVFSY